MLCCCCHLLAHSKFSVLYICLHSTLPPLSNNFCVLPLILRGVFTQHRLHHGDLYTCVTFCLLFYRLCKCLFAIFAKLFFLCLLLFCKLISSYYIVDAPLIIFMYWAYCCIRASLMLYILWWRRKVQVSPFTKHYICSISSFASLNSLQSIVSEHKHKQFLLQWLHSLCTHFANLCHCICAIWLIISQSTPFFGMLIFAIHDVNKLLIIFICFLFALARFYSYEFGLATAIEQSRTYWMEITATICSNW